MQLVFVDETGDKDDKDYMGLSVVRVDSTYYPAIKANAHKILRGGAWNEAEEFKGSCIFSMKGCPEVMVEKRIEMASKLIKHLHTSAKNLRMRFTYLRLPGTADKKVAYLHHIPRVLARTLKANPTKKNAKNLVSVICDERPDIKAVEVHRVVAPALEARGYSILEGVSMVPSSFHTVGLIFADIVGYLVGRIDVISNDSELFEIQEELFHANPKLRKLRASRDLVGKIKRPDWIEVNLTKAGNKVRA